jgi:hypothetical protein
LRSKSVEMATEEALQTAMSITRSQGAEPARARANTYHPKEEIADTLAKRYGKRVSPKKRRGGSVSATTLSSLTKGDLQAQITQKRMMLDDLGVTRARANTTHNYDSVVALEQAEANAQEERAAQSLERAATSARAPPIATITTQKGAGLDSSDGDEGFNDTVTGRSHESQQARGRALTHSSPSTKMFEEGRPGHGNNTERAKSFVMFTDKLNSER